MPANNYLPANDTNLAQWLANFALVATTNASTLKLSPVDTAAIQAAAQQFQANIGTAETAKQAAATAFHSKKTSRANGSSTARSLVKRIAALPNVSSSLIKQLGMTVPAPRRKVVPLTVPQALQAAVQPTTQILLTWDTNGNAPGTLYVMECKCEPLETWAIINTQTAARMMDGGCTPGVTTFYRVSAKRGTRTSMPSAEAVVYPR